MNPNAARGRSRWTPVKIMAISFGVAMFFSFLGGIWFGLERHEEARHRTAHAYYLAQGDFPRALEHKQQAAGAARGKFIGALGIAVGVGNVALFVAAILARLASSQPSVIRATSFLIRSMALGFFLFYVATHLILIMIMVCVVLLVFPLLW